MRDLYLVRKVEEGTIKILIQEEIDAEQENSKALGFTAGWPKLKFQVFKVQGEDVTELYTGD